MRRIVILVIVLVMVLAFTLFNNTSDGFVDVGRCGVDLPACSGERVRCINGYCKSDQIHHMPKLSDLQMIPSASY